MTLSYPTIKYFYVSPKLLYIYRVQGATLFQANLSCFCTCSASSYIQSMHSSIFEGGPISFNIIWLVYQALQKHLTHRSHKYTIRLLFIFSLLFCRSLSYYHELYSALYDILLILSPPCLILRILIYSEAQWKNT